MRLLALSLVATTTVVSFASFAIHAANANDSCGNDQVGAQSCPSGQYCQPWNPSSYQCRRIDAKCGVQEVGVDYYGADLAKFQLLLPEECCNKCFSTPGCKGYTFVNYNPDGKAYCYLKKGPGKRTAARGAVSATIGLPSNQCPDQLPDVDLVGNDLSTVSGVSFDQCCDKCYYDTSTPRCTAFTYSVNDKACYLKNGSGGYRASQGLISGIL